MKNDFDDLWRQQLRRDRLALDEFRTLQPQKLLELYNTSQSSVLEDLSRMAEAIPKFQLLANISAIEMAMASLPDQHLLSTSAGSLPDQHLLSTSALETALGSLPDQQ